MTYTLEQQFPKFAANMHKLNMGQQLDSLSDQEISSLEARLNIQLPPSYKRFLKCTRGFTALGGIVQMSYEHPFVHNFPPYDQLTEEQKASINQKGGDWPPPSQGMLCFAEFFMEGDGDQVLFDTSHKDELGEYPVYYYAHDPGTVRKIASSFEQWLNEFPEYEEFSTHANFR
jgi:hypothetical protein